MDASQILLISMTTVAFIFSLLVLFRAFTLFWDRSIPASQTDDHRKCAVSVLLVHSTSQLILSIITALLALVLIVLACRGGYNTACHVVLDIALTCVNSYQVRNNQ